MEIFNRKFAVGRIVEEFIRAYVYEIPIRGIGWIAAGTSVRIVVTPEENDGAERSGTLIIRSASA